MKSLEMLCGYAESLLKEVQNSLSYRELRAEKFDGVLTFELKMLYYDLLERVLEILPYKDVIEKERAKKWVCKHIKTIIHSHSDTELYEVLVNVNDEHFISDLVSLIERQIKAYVTVYYIFESVKERYHDVDPLLFEGVLEECILARHAFLCTGPEMYKKLKLVYEENAKYFERAYGRIGRVRIEEVREEMKSEYLFDYLCKLIEKMENSNYYVPSEKDRMTFCVVFSILNEHWEQLLNDEILFENSLPCAYLFEHAAEFDMQNRNSLFCAYEIIKEYASRRDNYIASLIEETPRYSLLHYQGLEDVHREMRRLPSSLIARKVNALVFYSNRKQYYIVQLYNQVPRNIVFFILGTVLSAAIYYVMPQHITVLFMSILLKIMKYFMVTLQKPLYKDLLFDGFIFRE